MKALAILPPDRWMEINLLDSLREHYCDDLQVFHYPGGMGRLGSRAWRTKRDELNADLLRCAKRLRSAGRLDFMFFLVYDDFLTVSTAEQLRALRVPMVNYHVDMAFQWYRVIRTAPYFDVLAVAQLTNVEHLRPYNSNIEWMPMAANPSFYSARASQVDGYRQDVSFVGSFNPYRRALLAACVQTGIKPVVYGRGWRNDAPTDYGFEWDLYKVAHDLQHYAIPRWRAEGIQSMSGPILRKFSRRRTFPELGGPDFQLPCHAAALPEIFRSSRVNLGFSDTGWHGSDDVVSSGNLQCRLRDFEVPMAGGFYLVQKAPDHGEYYKLGSEIETWSSAEELGEKVLYYLQHQREAERIREAGKKRALESHTWQHRFDRLFQRLRSCQTTPHTVHDPSPGSPAQIHA